MPVDRITSEVTGKVWQLVATPGQTVQAEETLIIVESMKMEIPIVATCAGTVREIRVAQGDDVVEGQHVASIDR